MLYLCLRIMIDNETNSQFNSRTGSVGDFESYAFGHSDFLGQKEQYA